MPKPPFITKRLKRFAKTFIIGHYGEEDDKVG